jgi:hypothetical protein
VNVVTFGRGILTVAGGAQRYLFEEAGELVSNRRSKEGDPEREERGRRVEYLGDVKSWESNVNEVFLKNEDKGGKALFKQPLLVTRCFCIVLMCGLKM